MHAKYTIIEEVVERFLLCRVLFLSMKEINLKSNGHDIDFEITVRQFCSIFKFLSSPWPATVVQSLQPSISSYKSASLNPGTILHKKKKWFKRVSLLIDVRESNVSLFSSGY
jgi:hypothetical protein